MSVIKICVVALLFCASVSTARNLNKREFSLRDFHLNDLAVEGNTGLTEEEKCDCGEYGLSCKLENGKKICTCIYPYQDNRHGVCITCDCGQDLLLECAYDENITKICTCKEGYITGRDGLCQKSCSDEDPCDNGGKCVNSLCQCLPGTRGDKCEVVEPCTDDGKLWEKCGYVMGVKCLFNQTSRTSYCGCKDGNEGYDVQEKRCKKKCADHGVCKNGGQCVGDICKCLSGTFGDKCEIIENCVVRSDVDELCGGPLTRCKFNPTSLKPYCTCILPDQYGYNAKLKECKECNCGQNSHGCMFQEHSEDDSEDYEKICKCDYGYGQNDKGQCEECDCGANATCHFKKKEPICVCDEGFAMKNGTCEECVCSPHATCTFNESDKVCTCDKGYEEVKGICKAIQSSSTSTDGSSSVTTPATDKTSVTGTGAVSSTDRSTEETPLPNSGSTGWRTSTIILGVLLALCLIGLVFGLYKLKYRNYTGV